MKYKTACLRGYLEVIGGVLLKGPLMTRALIGPIALLEAVTCFLSFV